MHYRAFVIGLVSLVISFTASAEGQSQPGWMTVPRVSAEAHAGKFIRGQFTLASSLSATCPPSFISRVSPPSPERKFVMHSCVDTDHGVGVAEIIDTAHDRVIAKLNLIHIHSKPPAMGQVRPWVAWSPIEEFALITAHEDEGSDWMTVVEIANPKYVLPINTPFHKRESGVNNLIDFGEGGSSSIVWEDPHRFHYRIRTDNDGIQEVLVNLDLKKVSYWRVKE